MVNLLTPNELARRLDVSVHLVRSLLESTHCIAPRAWVDGVPIYGREALDRLRDELTTLQLAENRNHYEGKEAENAS